MPFVTTQGARIHYEVAGSGPTVLLIQGIGVIGEGWRPQVRGLADRYRLIRFDNRGIGQSTIDASAASPLTIETMAMDALAVLDAVGTNQAHLVGHSMGGVIAQQVGLLAKPRLRSLALLCTFGKGKDAVRMTPAVLWRGLRMMVGTRRMRRQAFVEMVMPPALWNAGDGDKLAAELAPLFGRDLAEQPPILFHQMRAMAQHDTSARLSELGTIPTLVMSAAEDRVAFPRYGRALAAAIPGARYVELAAAGHGVPIQCPAEVNDLLAQHFAAAESAHST